MPLNFKSTQLQVLKQLCAVMPGSLPYQSAQPHSSCHFTELRFPPMKRELGEFCKGTSSNDVTPSITGHRFAPNADLLNVRRTRPGPSKSDPCGHLLLYKVVLRGQQPVVSFRVKYNVSCLFWCLIAHPTYSQVPCSFGILGLLLRIGDNGPDCLSTWASTDTHSGWRGPAPHLHRGFLLRRIPGGLKLEPSSWLCILSYRIVRRKGKLWSWNPSCANSDKLVPQHL